MNENDHAPWVQALAEKDDWAGLVRYWMAYGFHRPALDRAIEVVRRRAAGSDQPWTALASHLQELRANPLESHKPPAELETLRAEAEIATVRLTVLLPQASVCELIWLSPVKSRDQLSQIGIDAASRAVQIATTLDDFETQAFFYDLAARGHAERRELKEAVASETSALKIYRRLAKVRSAIYQPRIARSLNNLAKRLGDLGQLEVALASAKESVELYRQLVKEDRVRFLRWLAASLNNLAIMLAGSGQREEALASAREAVDIRRELVAQNRSDFLPDLARSLNTLTARLRDLGRSEDAVASAQEEVDTLLESVAQNGAAFLPDLARSRDTLATILLDLGRREEALLPAQEAVKVYWELVAENRMAFLPDMARSLNNQAASLRGLARSEEALVQGQEAVKLYRELVAKNRTGFLPNLAGSLNNLAVLLHDLGWREQALARAQEAVEFYRESVTRNRATFLPDLAMSLNTLATMLIALGRRGEVLAPAQEAVEFYRELVAQNRTAFLPGLAGSLNNLAVLFRALGRRHEALARTQEAGAFLDEVARLSSIDFTEERMRCWVNQGLLLRQEDSRLGWPDYLSAREALRSAREVLERFRVSFASPEQRKRVQGEAAEIYEQLVQTCIDVWGISLTDGSPDYAALGEAVEVAEASRSRHLVDLLADEALQPKFTPQPLVEAFRQLRRRLRQVERRLREVGVGGSQQTNAAAPSPTTTDGMKLVRLATERPTAPAPKPTEEPELFGRQLEELHREHGQLKQGHKECLAQIQQHDSRFDPDQPVPPVTFKVVKEELFPTDVPTAIIQYTLMREHGLALVILRDTVLPVTLPGLNDRAGWDLASPWLAKYYGKSRATDPEAWLCGWAEALPTLLEPVARLVLHPVLKALEGRGIQRLIIAPHRALHLFPLHSCPLTGSQGEGRYVADEFEIVYTPSLSLLHRCVARKPRDTDDLLLVQNPTGDPDLIFSEVEGRLLRQFFPACASFDRTTATKELILASTERAHVMHYTGHSRFDRENPLNSALMLQTLNQAERCLTLRDAFTELNLHRNRLTILNGCESGVLWPDSMDEYVNLPTGFHFAGAGCVISTLWPVWDISSALLMMRFHLEWKHGGRSDCIAAALRRAQNWLRRDITSGQQLRDETLPKLLEGVDEDLKQQCFDKAQYYARAFPDAPPFAHPVYWAPFIASGFAYPLAGKMKA